MTDKLNYGTALLSGFEYLLEKYPEVFVIGQGLWSPWYVGNTMKNLDVNFGKDRVIDTPVSESGVTGMAVGASLSGGRPIVVHPRIDFALYAMDSIVNQAAKWSHVTGGKSHPSVTIRTIINRGGEQGAQHSQSLHSWFAHIPGLKVLMPYSVSDARDMLIAATLSRDPVIFIDDRWLYEQEDTLDPIEEKSLDSFTPKIIKSGQDLTIVGTSYSTKLALDASKELQKDDIDAEVIDTRTLNPLRVDQLVESVKKTSNLIVVDGGWKNCGFSSEIIASVMENLPPNTLDSSPLRITLPDAPAPTSRFLESIYYPTVGHVTTKIRDNLNLK